MQHKIHLACVLFRLRPVTLEDAPFIVQLRTDPVRSRFLHEISPRVQDQVAWLRNYFERPDDYYFIVEAVASGEPQGTIGIYDLDTAGGATFGRWILKRDSIAALESAWLIHEVGFANVGLGRLSSLVIVENEPVVSFQRSFGATRVRDLDGHFLVRGERKSAVEYCVTAAEWPPLRDRHYATLSRFGQRRTANQSGAASSTN